MRQLMCGWNNIFGEVHDDNAVTNFSCREVAAVYGLTALRNVLLGHVVEEIRAKLSYNDFHVFPLLSCAAVYLESIFDRISFACHTYNPSATEDTNTISIELIKQRYPSIQIKPSTTVTPFGVTVLGADLHGGAEVFHAFYWYQLFLRAPLSTPSLEDPLAWACRAVDCQYKRAWNTTPSTPVEWARCIASNKGPLRFLECGPFTRPSQQDYRMFEGELRNVLGDKSSV